MAYDSVNTIATKYHCINCGAVWGDGEDIGSSGVCSNCFVEWAKSKKPCFGIETYIDKKHCSLRKYCKEYYGVK